MAPIRRSNRASKPRAHQRQQPEFVIYTEPPNSSSQFPDTLTTQPHEGLNHDRGLDLSNDEGLDSSDDEDLDSSDDEDLHLSDNKDLAEDLTEGLIKGLTE